MSNFFEMWFFQLGCAYLLDLLCGDPHWLPHPVVGIGWLISRTEKFLRKLINQINIKFQVKLKWLELLAGLILTVWVLLVTFCFIDWLIKLATLLHPYLASSLKIYFLYSALATKCLAVEAHKVYQVLQKDDLFKARQSLAMLVGRETKHLSKTEIIRGVVETTAENTVDGVVSPLFYAVLGSFFWFGAPVVYLYKAINTLDSMVGYKNERYLYFGKVSAKLDDLVNWLPARVTGFLIPWAAWCLRYNWRQSLWIMWRDRAQHLSPNCAYPEAAVAGALEVQLGGNNVYFGKVVAKPTIGDSKQPIEVADILKTIKLMYLTSGLAIFFFGLLGLILSKGIWQ